MLLNVSREINGEPKRVIEMNWAGVTEWVANRKRAFKDARKEPEPQPTVPAEGWPKRRPWNLASQKYPTGHDEPTGAVSTGPPARPRGRSRPR